MQPRTPAQERYYKRGTKKQQCNCGQRHLSLVEFLKLSPYQQGYAAYMQAAHPGSELKDHQKNPYHLSTKEWEYFNDGERAAVLVAQDSEE